MGGAGGQEYALVQAWTVNVNGDFRDSFEIAFENPDPSKFQPEACAEFRKTVEALFGVAAKDHKLYYCSKATSCTDQVFLGKPSQFVQFLDIPCVKESLDVKSRDGNTIEVKTVDKKGKVGSKQFTFGDDEENMQVLYRRSGYSSHARIKPHTLFIEDCRFIDVTS